MNEQQEITGYTTKDVVVDLPWGAAIAASLQDPITVPAGTTVILVDSSLGGHIWAIAAPDVAYELTGDRHMSDTRYIFIDGAAVMEES